jgi:uncharacterized protein CbrC (UPF0167 family)
MKFKYFDGPLTDMSGLLLDGGTCDLCKKKHNFCFNLSFAISTTFQDEEKDGKIGCYDCLLKGDFEFWHDTEFGFLDENGLTKVYSHNMDNPPLVDRMKLSELRKTPQIITYQQEVWLTHCNDFMVYKGIWEPMDFYKNSETGNGRDLFIEMTDSDLNHLWDDSLVEGENILEQWYATYYVFECLHCKKMRGNWDCD